MSRFHALQASFLVALLTIVGIGATTLQPPTAHAKGTAAIAQEGGTSGAALGTQRTAPGGDLSTAWFGKFWKKFKKIVGAVIDFIDRIIDTTIELMVDADPDGSARPDRWSPTLPSFPELQPQALA